MTRVGTLVPEGLAARLPDDVATRRVNWLEVARMDVGDAGRSWQLYSLCGLLVVLLLVGATVPVLTSDERVYIGGVVLMSGNSGLLLPLVGLVVGYRSVVGEQETGSLRVLLGLPITRRDVVVGKLLGRSVVFGAPLLLGLTIAGVELWSFAAGFDLRHYVLFVGLTLVYGLVFVGMGVGISAFVRSRARAMGAAMSVFTLIVFVWQAIPTGLFYFQHGRFVETQESVSPWYVFSGNANPLNVYSGLSNEWLLEGGSMATGQVTTSLYDAYGGRMVASAEPFYLQPEFMLFVLVLWGVVPLLVGAWRFDRRDLE